MGGAKATRLLRGRPLVEYPAKALAAVCDRIAVVCKQGTELPAGGPWEVWDDEPVDLRHPAVGIAHAVERAGGQVLVCAADMPFVTPAECAALMEAAARRPDAVAIVAVDDGGLQPLLGIYRPRAAHSLRAAGERGQPLRPAVGLLDPVRVDLPAAALRSLDTREALSAAELELG